MELEYNYAMILNLNGSFSVRNSIPEIELPEGFDRIEKIHLTLIGGQALKQFEEELKPQADGTWPIELLFLPFHELLELADDVSIAEREDYPVDEENPELGVESRKTLFLPILNQEEVREMVNGICEVLGITNPEPDRFFHVSLANIHGGNPWKSVGDICESDV